MYLRSKPKGAAPDGLTFYTCVPSLASVLLFKGGKNGTLTTGSCLNYRYKAVNWCEFVDAVYFVLAVAALFWASPDEVSLVSKTSLEFFVDR